MHERCMSAGQKQTLVSPPASTSDLTVQSQPDLVGVCGAVHVGGDTLVLCLVLFRIVPGVDVQRARVPAHGCLRVTCHIVIPSITTP